MTEAKRAKYYAAGEWFRTPTLDAQREYLERTSEKVREALQEMECAE